MTRSFPAICALLNHAFTLHVRRREQVERLGELQV
jgi:hypothetical protein